jgi:transcription initiation factor TFIIF subunit beta
MADLSIKPDPDAPGAGAGASPAAFSEEDIYEDAGDLEFNPDPAFQSLYLAKVPKYVWEAWASLDDDAEIQIGTIRNTTITAPDGEQKAWSLGIRIDEHC